MYTVLSVNYISIKLEEKMGKWLISYLEGQTKIAIGSEFTIQFLNH